MVLWREKEAGLKDDLTQLFKALDFSAKKHRDQRRKDKNASPYINHPIEVANILWTIGGVSDMPTLIAAILHDTLEDTDTTTDEIRLSFGDEVLQIVLEVSDDKTLSKPQRKQKQIAHSPHLSGRAKHLKLADKICNVRDVAFSPPEHWPLQRRLDYLQWAEAVINGLRGASAPLEKCFDETLKAAREQLARENTPMPT